MHQALHCLEEEIMHEQVNSWPCLEAAKNHPRAKSVQYHLSKKLNFCVGYPSFNLDIHCVPGLRLMRVLS